jgi:hypothetical protein
VSWISEHLDGHRTPHALALLALSAFLGCLALISSATAATQYVDGVSDQSMAAWGGPVLAGPLTDFLPEAGIGNPPSHIILARYVVQWNVMSEESDGADPGGDYREQFEAWYADALSRGLALDVSLVAYHHGEPPPASDAFQVELQALLNRFPAIRYVEAWDEPNDTPGLTPAGAAHYTNAALSDCESRGCTVIAGNLLDSANMVSFENAYAADLTLEPANWGVHPYFAVKAHRDSAIREFAQELPTRGDATWFTEIGAYVCFHAKRQSEAQQASDASWLVNTLMPAVGPLHVFYYEFMFKNHQEQPCSALGGPNTSIYNDHGEPRLSASVILGSVAAATQVGLALGGP